MREGVEVTGFERKGRRIMAVLTDQGRIACETVVNCAGIWARRVGRMAGVAIAAGAVEHQYFVTEKRLDLPRDLPEALQHRHPPERGLRHAINVLPDTGLAELYGEGEVVVNSEHRRAVAKVARGLRVCAHALDGVIARVVPSTHAVHITVDVGFPLVAAVTARSAAELGLAPGTRVCAVFKASAVYLIGHAAPA